jgi:hypothetical protein
LEEYSTIFKVCNDEIEPGILVPNDLQKAQLAYFAMKGKEARLELKRFNRWIGKSAHIDH